MKHTSRRRARECIVQALYSWQLSHNSIIDIERYFLLEKNIHEIDVKYFHELLSGIVKHREYLDGLIQPYLSCLVNKIGEVERAVLRIALFELTKRKDIPYKVVLNEAIELTKTFGAKDCYKFINSILDKIVSNLFLKNHS